MPFSNWFKDVEDARIYPSYGYWQDGQWHIPVTVWVHEPRSKTGKVLSRVIAQIGNISHEQELRLRERLADLVADSESFERVELMFDRDPQKTTYTITDQQGDQVRSDLNGRIQGEILLSGKDAQRLLSAQNSINQWLSLTVISKEHRGNSRVRLIPPTGKSVISDIDDTIKITDVLGGKKAMISNTLFEPFLAAPGMAERYRGLEDRAFHYVSGSPWQLFDPLFEFLIEGPGGFPPGSFHMKNVRKNLFSRDSWSDLRKLIAGGATATQKMQQITEIIQHFPQRRFLLVGDSGEHDPEIYRTIRDNFPEQIEEIWIRDVANDRVRNPSRLSGMQIIDP